MAKAKKSKILKESALRKKWADSNIAANVVLGIDEMLWLPSRILALNDLMGGGIPFGKIIEIFGLESSGKSLIANDFAYTAQQLGGVVLWNDAESSFTKHWAELNGLDLERVELFPEKSIELISDWSADMIRYYRGQLTKNEPILLVIDSIASLDCLSNLDLEQTDRKAEMGNRAKAMDLFLRTRNRFFSEMGVCVILINQVRSKIGASKFESPFTTPGGHAAAFYASIRLGIYGGKQLKQKIGSKEYRVGRVTTIRVEKNKVAAPKPSLKSVPVYFDPQDDTPVGFDRYFGLPEILERNKVVKRKTGSSSYYLEDKLIARGEESLIKLLKEDDKLRAKLIRKAGINTVRNTQRKIKGIKENLFNYGNSEQNEEE